MTTHNIKEVDTYSSPDAFIEGMHGVWDMLGSSYKKLDKETVLVDNITWKLVKGNMTCLTK